MKEYKAWVFKLWKIGFNISVKWLWSFSKLRCKSKISLSLSCLRNHGNEQKGHKSATNACQSYSYSVNKQTPEKPNQNSKFVCSKSTSVSNLMTELQYTMQSKKGQLAPPNPAAVGLLILSTNLTHSTTALCMCIYIYVYIYLYSKSYLCTFQIKYIAVYIYSVLNFDTLSLHACCWNKPS